MAVNNAAVNTGAQMSVRVPAFTSFGRILGTGIVDHIVLMFKLLGNHHTELCVFELDL